MSVQHDQWSSAGARRIIYITVAVVVSFFMWLSAPKIMFSPHGIALPVIEKASVLKKESAANVQVLQGSIGGGDNLAIIHVAAHSTEQNQQTERDVLTYAKTLAANQGANTLAIEQFGYAPSAVYPGLSMYVLTARAVHQGGQMNILPMEPSIVLPN